MKELTREEYDEIINKELEKHGVTCEQVRKEPEWYNNYTFTTEEHTAWREWTIDYLRKKCKVSKRIAERKFQWIDLAHGLRVEDE